MRVTPEDLQHWRHRRAEVLAKRQSGGHARNAFVPFTGPDGTHDAFRVTCDHVAHLERELAKLAARVAELEGPVRP